MSKQTQTKNGPHVTCTGLLSLMIITRVANEKSSYVENDAATKCNAFELKWH